MCPPNPIMCLLLPTWHCTLDYGKQLCINREDLTPVVTGRNAMYSAYGWKHSEAAFATPLLLFSSVFTNISWSGWELKSRVSFPIVLQERETSACSSVTLATFSMQRWVTQILSESFYCWQFSRGKGWDLCIDSSGCTTSVQLLFGMSGWHHPDSTL